MKKLKMLKFGILAACIVTALTPVATHAKTRLSQKKAEIAVDDSVKLKIKGSRKKASWSSADKSIASVSGSGKVTGIKKGITTITAKVGGKRLSCRVAVIDRYYRGSGLEVNATRVTMSPGAFFTVRVKNTILDPKSFTWKSSNPKKCKVTKKGVIKPKRNGTYTITVRTKDKKRSAKIKVTVINGLPTTSNEIKGSVLRVTDLRVSPRITSVTKGHVFIPSELNVVATRSDNVQVSPKEYTIKASNTGDGKYQVAVFYKGLMAETFVDIAG